MNVEPLSPIVHSGEGGPWQLVYLLTVRESMVGGHGGVTHSTDASSYGIFTLVAWRYLGTGVVAGVTKQSQGEAFPHNTVQEVWLLCSAMGVFSHQGGFGAVETVVCECPGLTGSQHSS